MTDELSVFENSLKKITEELDSKLKEKHVGFRNSKENHQIVILQRQKIVLTDKIEYLKKIRAEIKISEQEIADLTCKKCDRFVARTVEELQEHLDTHSTPEPILSNAELGNANDILIEPQEEPQEEESKEPLKESIMCEKCKEAPTKDPSKLCAICKTKRDYKSRIPSHG